MFTVTPDYVTGFILQAGSGNPVVLEARRQDLMRRQQPAKIGSLAFIVIGGIMTVTIIGAIVGLPMLAIAGWVHWKVRGNLRVIDEAYRALVSSPAAAAAPQA